MTATICTRRLNKVWRAYQVEKVPHSEGIYVIGFKHHLFDIEVNYVGQSKDIHLRMEEHKNKDLAIDKFVRQQFEDNDAEDLGVKWIKETNPDTKESKYIKCIAEKVGNWPRFDMRKLIGY